MIGKLSLSLVAGLLAVAALRADEPPADDQNPLPAVKVEVRTADPRGDDVTPTAPVTELAQWAPQLFVSATAALPADQSFNFTGRMVTANVPGLPRGLAVISGPVDGQGETLTAERGTLAIVLAVPRALLPGSYRVEVVEADPPNRVAGAMELVVRAPADSGAEVNLADPDLGGLVERVSGEEGAGLTWAPQILLPGNSKPWHLVPRPDAPADAAAPELPGELVLSFFQRQPVVLARLELTAAAAENLPQQVEVWGSTESATSGFAKLAAGEVTAGDSTLAVTLPPTPVRFLLVRILSRQNDAEPVLVGLRAIEGHADGYTPLLKRNPAIADWRIQPRHAAQQGLFYLSASAMEFQKTKECMGCHVQSQALMGMSVAAKSDYIISVACRHALAGYTLQSQNDPGDFARSPSRAESEDVTNTVFAALGLDYSTEETGAVDSLVRAARWLAKQQAEDGSMPVTDGRLPVTQGAILSTSHAVDTWAQALAAGADPAVRQAEEKGMAFIAQAETQTTQDQVFKALALLRHGDAAAKKQAHQICVQLLQAQRGDGGWLLDQDDTQPTSVFATGEVLYALRTAGFSPGSPAFQRGVRYLIFQQKQDGSWQEHQESTPFASTMWPVIALTGSFTTKIEPAHIVVTALPRPLPPPAAPVAPAPAAASAPAALPPNLELILDCSGSMDTPLGHSTRLETAKDVMRRLIAKLPDGLNVGLRLYGHRYNSFSRKSSTDTELIVPIGPLDRARLAKTIDGATAHGQTPLVLSSLEAGNDLKKAGGGAIVLVTDGEESCGGEPRKAGPKLAALGVPLRLDIIGFTLTGSRIAGDMRTFAGATGGRFFTAADGIQLASALTAATSAAPRPPPPPVPVAAEVRTAPPEDFAYDILTSAGEKVASGSTLNLEAPGLEPGTYRIVLHDGAKTATLDDVKLEAAQTVELRYSPADGQIRPAQ